MKKNQRGFTVVEGLVTVFVLALVIGVGFYVLNNHTNKRLDSNASSSQTSELVIKELGVKMPLSGELSGLKYKVDSDSEGKGILLYTDAYVAADKACTGTNQEPSDVNFMAVAKTTEAPDSDGLLDAITLKKFKDFRLGIYDGPTTPCYYAKNPEGLKKLNEIKSKLERETKKAFKNAEEIR